MGAVARAKHRPPDRSGWSAMGGVFIFIFIYFVIQFYLLRTSLCYTIRRMYVNCAANRPSLFPKCR